MPYAHITGWVMSAPEAVLTNDDISCDYLLPAEHLNAQAFAFGLAAVLYFTFTFFMCHG